MRKFAFYLGLILTATFLLSACGPSEDTIRIGSKEFTEQAVLGNMYKLLLEDAGYKTVYTPMGGTSENHQALLNGDIDVYPEYTGTALMSTLNKEYDPSMTPDDVYGIVTAEYADQFNFVWGDQTAFNNTYCLTMTQERAQELGVASLSDLSIKKIIFLIYREFF